MKESILKEKECSKCHKFLHLSFFNKRTRSKTGLSSICKDCDSKRNREYRNKVKREIERGQRQWKKPKEKECKQCHRLLLASEFNKNILSRDGLTSDCKSCDHKRQKKYRERPEVRKRLKNYCKEYRSRPDVKKRMREYQRKYAKKPKRKEWKRKYERRSDRKKKKKEYMKKYTSRPDVKE